MKDELWLEHMRQRLKDCSEPLPSSGWERLEKELPLPSEASASESRRLVPFRRWSVAAAAALLVAISGISLWFLDSPLEADLRQAVGEASLLSLPNRPSGVNGAFRGMPSGQELLSSTELDGKATGETGKPAGDASFTIVEEYIDIEETGEDRQPADSAANMTPRGKTSETKQKRKAVLDNPESLLAMADKPEKKNKGWGISLSVGNAGGMNSALDGNDGYHIQQNSPGYSYSRLDVLATSTGLVSIPEGQKLVYRDGIPFLQSKARKAASIDHRLPLSFGFSVRKSLPKGFSLETGLTYTYLVSDIQFVDNWEKATQKLHYLGIPLRANWDFFDRNSFTLYVSAGGAMEKCVFGRTGGEKTVVDPLQFSVMSAVGLQYDLSRRIGLYIEPGVSYFFDDGSDVETYRKENPCTFTLQAGLRLNY